MAFDRLFSTTKQHRKKLTFFEKYDYEVRNSKKKMICLFRQKKDLLAILVFFVLLSVIGANMETREHKYIFAVLGKKNDKKKTNWVEKLQKYLTLIQTILTISAIILGGWWFLESRELNPKANIISHRIDHVELEGTKWRLVHLAIEIENKGKTRIDVKHALVYVQKILPVPEKFVNHLSAPLVNTATINYKMIQKKEEHIFSWPRLGDGFDSAVDYTLEPFEKDMMYYDFIIPKDIKVIRTYSKIYSTSNMSDTPRVYGAVWNLSEKYN